MLSANVVLQELKLSTVLLEDLQQLSRLLLQLSVDLKCDAYLDYYTMFSVCVTGAEVEHGITGGPTTAVTPVAAAVGGPQV